MSGKGEESGVVWRAPARGHFVGLCADCQHARPNDMWDGMLDLGQDEGFPDLASLAERYSLVCMKGHMSGGEPTDPTTLAFTMDGSRYRGELLVSPNFGCVMWQAKRADDSASAAKSQPSEDRSAPNSSEAVAVKNVSAASPKEPAP